MPRSALFLLCFCLGLAVCQAQAESGKASDAQAATAEGQLAPLNERSQEEARGLQRQLPEQQQRQLKAGTEGFLGLWLPANAAEAQGVVILLPGDGETPDWPQVIGPLRRKLPDAGWHTLSFSLPDLPDSLVATEKTPDPAQGSAPSSTDQTAKAPAETSAAEKAAEDAGIAQRKAHAERVLARVQAAVDLALQEKPAAIVLLGHRSGAYWAARYLGERTPSEVHNLLLIDPEVPGAFKPSLEESVPLLQVAVGDFYYSDGGLQSQSARLRLQASKRQKSANYLQISLQPLADSVAQQEQLYRRLRGWLSKHLQTAEQDQRKP